MKNKRIDFLVVVILLILGASLAYFFNPGNFVFGFLYLGIPSFYLLWRKKENYKKIGWGLLIFGVLFGSIFDFIGSLNNAWSTERILMKPFVIGGWPIENVVAYLWMTLFILVFYEHFLDNKSHSRLSKKHSSLFIFSLLVLIFVFLAYSANYSALRFHHFYLYTGFAAILFPILFAFYNPKIIPKFATLAFFFFFVWLALEVVGVKNQNWFFPAAGDFVGTVTLFGAHFPFEEVFFWFMWYPAVIVAYYEYFIDDQK
jgi:hypothetical protein